jgi:hypothetical protein
MSCDYPGTGPERGGGDLAYIRRGGEFRVNSQTNSDQYAPSAAALSGGGFVVTWYDTIGGDSEIKAQLYDSAGVAVGGEFQVNTQTGHNQLWPRATALNDGRFVVTWQDNSGHGDGSAISVQAQIFSASGTKIGSEFVVNTQANWVQSFPAIASLPNGGFVVAWHDLSGSPSVKAQVYDANGARVGGELLVDSGTANIVGGFPRIAALANGGFVVAWEDAGNAPGDTSASNIKAQVYDATNTKVGTEFLVNTATAGEQTHADIAALIGGGFVVSWVDANGTREDVKAQVYDASGAKVGTEFVVNIQTIGRQADQSVIALSDGNFVIAWSDTSFSSANVMAQVFDPTGARVGPEEFLVNTATEGGQIVPAMTALPNGGFLVTWADNSNSAASGPGYSPGFDIKGQIYESSSISVPVADLDVLDTMTLTSQSVLVGATTTVKYTLANSGTAAAGASSVAIYRSSDATFDGSDTRLTTRSFGPIDAQAQSDDSVALTLSTLGTWYIIAVADYSSQIPGELSERNNPSNAVLVTVSDWETISNADGSFTIHRIDAFNQQFYVDYFLYYDALGHLTNQVTNNDDGTHFIYGWDAQDQAGWTGYRVATDSLGRAISQITNNDDGTHLAYAWDVLNQFDWADYRVTTDSLGRATSQVTTNDDGTHFIDAWDVPNQADWSSYRVTTDSLDRATLQVTTNDDGTHFIDAWDVLNQASWSSYRVTTDSLGRATSQVTTNDDGTHFIHAWDGENQAVWSDYVVHTDAVGRALEQTTNFDDGTHTIMVWDVQNQYDWAFVTNAYDAEWHRVSQQGVYDDGTGWLA